MAASEWITVKEASKYSGYHLNYIRRLVRSAKVKAEKRSGHDWWIDRKSLEKYVAAMKVLGAEKYNPYRKA